jgi:hypothetical protein
MLNKNKLDAKREWKKKLNMLMSAQRGLGDCD